MYYHSVDHWNIYDHLQGIELSYLLSKKAIKGANGYEIFIYLIYKKGFAKLWGANQHMANSTFIWKKSNKIKWSIILVPQKCFRIVKSSNVPEPRYISRQRMNEKNEIRHRVEYFMLPEEYSNTDNNENNLRKRFAVMGSFNTMLP